MVGQDYYLHYPDNQLGLVDGDWTSTDAPDSSSDEIDDHETEDGESVASVDVQLDDADACREECDSQLADTEHEVDTAMDEESLDAD